MKWECKKPGLWVCWECPGKYWGWIEKASFGSGWFGRVFLEYADRWEVFYYNSFKEAKEDITDDVNDNEATRRAC